MLRFTNLVSLYTNSFVCYILARLVFELFTLLLFLSGLFYYTLGNLEPHLRSPTNAIQLVSVVKTSYIEKYGIDTILEPFVQAIIKLESVSGVACYIHVHLAYSRKFLREDTCSWYMYMYLQFFSPRKGI